PPPRSCTPRASSGSSSATYGRFASRSKRSASHRSKSGTTTASRCKRLASRLEIDGDADAALAAQNVDADVLGVAPQHQVDACVADAQILDADPRQEPRQHRLSEADLRRLLPERHAEAGLKQHAHRAARPRLRQARDWIACRPLAMAAAEAAEQLREAP